MENYIGKCVYSREFLYSGIIIGFNEVTRLYEIKVTKWSENIDVNGLLVGYSERIHFNYVLDLLKSNSNNFDVIKQYESDFCIEYINCI